MKVETPEAFRGRVRAWLDANAPRKGEPGDFSAVRGLGLPRELTPAPDQTGETPSVRRKA